MTELPRVCYTAGVFDLFHRGHLNLLWASRRMADILIVGVVSDLGCFRYKGVHPHENSQTRIARIARLDFVDVVVLQNGTDPTEHLERFRPNLMTHGDDWARLREGHDTLENLGVEFVTVPYTDGISSTVLRARRPCRNCPPVNPPTLGGAA